MVDNKAFNAFSAFCFFLGPFSLGCYFLGLPCGIAEQQIIFTNLRPAHHENNDQKDYLPNTTAL